LLVQLTAIQTKLNQQGRGERGVGFWQRERSESDAEMIL